MRHDLRYRMKSGLYLEKVREIDKHIVARFFLPARNIETDGYNVETFPPFSKLVLHREGV
jgi:hypothetical protein